MFSVEWRKRWFVLDGAKLRYYLEDNKEEELGNVELAMIQKIDRKGSYLYLHTEFRTYELFHKDPEQVETWRSAIKANYNMVQGGEADDAPFQPEIHVHTPSTQFESIHIQHQGTLMKAGDDALGSWATRHFVLSKLPPSSSACGGHSCLFSLCVSSSLVCSLSACGFRSCLM